MARTTISRRLLLINSAGAVIAATARPASAEMSRPEGTEPSPQLGTLIERHKAAYAEFLDFARRPGSNRRSCARADRLEQGALLAVCSYPAVTRNDRRAKADYLLDVEARGELDLEAHMRAILHSMKAGEA